MMKKLHLLSVSRFVIYFFALPAAYNQPSRLQLLQMVGYSRTAHIYQGRQIHYTFFAMAENPENADAASITKLLENVGYGLKLADGRHMIALLFEILPVIMGQFLFDHGTFLLSYLFYHAFSKMKIIFIYPKENLILCIDFSGSRVYIVIND